MMETAPVLRLNAQQAEQLVRQCAAYRKYAFQCLPPSPERNQTMRGIQAVEGRLLSPQGQAHMETVLVVSREEGGALRQMISIMMQAYSVAQPSEVRTQALGELAVLRVLIERALRTI